MHFANTDDGVYCDLMVSKMEVRGAVNRHSRFENFVRLGYFLYAGARLQVSGVFVLPHVFPMAAQVHAVQRAFILWLVGRHLDSRGNSSIVNLFGTLAVHLRQ